MLAPPSTPASVGTRGLHIGVGPGTAVDTFKPLGTSPRRAPRSHWPPDVTSRVAPAGIWQAHQLCSLPSPLQRRPGFRPACRTHINWMQMRCPFAGTQTRSLHRHNNDGLDRRLNGSPVQELPERDDSRAAFHSPTGGCRGGAIVLEPTAGQSQKRRPFLKHACLAQSRVQPHQTTCTYVTSQMSYVIVTMS